MYAENNQEALDLTIMAFRIGETKSVLLPVMVKLGVDPIHFGIVFVVCCEIGFETPPLGENLFIASGIGDTSIEDISVKAIPFSIVEISAVFLIAYIPQISLWLPRLFGY